MGIIWPLLDCGVLKLYALINSFTDDIQRLVVWTRSWVWKYQAVETFMIFQQPNYEEDYWNAAAFYLFALLKYKDWSFSLVPFQASC